ncbi:MAG: glycosyltransferase [Pseudomonadota bacterium]
MRILVLSGGGRGDMQPYAALASGFRQAGCEVTLACVPEFTFLLEGRGIEPWISDVKVKELFESDDAIEMFASGKNPVRMVRLFTRLMIPVLEQGMADLMRVIPGVDGLVLSSMSFLTGTGGMERVGVPTVAAYPFPTAASREYPAILAPPLPSWLPGRSLYNRVSHWLLARLIHFFLGRHHLRIMERLPLPSRPAPLPLPLLFGFSPQVFARPADWPTHTSITGYWFLDRLPGWTPPAELAAFLDAGEPPVYVGFGSMNTRDPAAATSLVCQALERAGRRGILVTGMGGLRREDLPSHVLALDSVPHDWLFEQVAAVVHHGGAGTTAAGLRAGKPTICVPHMADQFFWSRRVLELGVGPRPISRKRLSVEALTQAIQTATTDRGMQQQATVLGERIRQERGVDEAVERALQHFRQGRA